MLGGGLGKVEGGGTCTTMWDRSRTRHSCLHTSRFFSKGVITRFSSSSNLESPPKRSFFGP